MDRVAQDRIIRSVLGSCLKDSSEVEKVFSRIRFLQGKVDVTRPERDLVCNLIDRVTILAFYGNRTPRITINEEKEAFLKAVAALNRHFEVNYPCLPVSYITPTFATTSSA